MQSFVVFCIVGGYAISFSAYDLILQGYGYG